MKSFSPLKRILFWFAIILFGAALWRIISNERGATPVQVARYSEFLEQVDKENVREITLFVTQAGAEVEGRYLKPNTRFNVTIPREVIPELITQLRQKRVGIDVQQRTAAEWRTLLLNMLPLLLLVGFWVSIMAWARRARKRGEGLPQGSAKRRTGIGYDLHRLEVGRTLALGGIEVPFEKGPVGHSDGDALAHAICDALLGAAGLGDIGTHFPDTDPKWKGVSSLRFLEHIRKLLDDHRMRIGHIDAVVIVERPKLGPHFPAMRAALAQALGIQPEQINLKAKTNEGVDAIGRGDAIAAQAIATLEV